jgi:cell division protein FtsB
MSATLADICKELEIELTDNASSMGRRPGQTCARNILQKVLTDEGEAHLRSVLITIMQTENNKRMLIRPVILAVSDVLRTYPNWYGGDWLDAFDKIELSELYEEARADREGVAPRHSIAARLIDKLRKDFAKEEPQARLL